MNHQEILESITRRFKKVLGDNLVGIYVHGSIAFGCYNREESDIDFLVVVHMEPAISEKVQLVHILTELTDLAPKKGLEMSLVLEQDCKVFKYPTPFYLHFSLMHLQKCLHDPYSYCETMKGYDVDLAAHFTVVREVGYPLIGQPVKEVFARVPREDYLDSIKQDVSSAMIDVGNSPVDVILNLCRVVGYIAEDKVMSKEQGGRWAMKHLPDKYINLVEIALKCYQNGKILDQKIIFNKPITKDFCDYMLRCIFHTEY